ncbi:hypothetical protein ACFYYB_41315 [Streptomyces sp. NPDC002886]|uniref:hypothetical protein n=1 Tax=Streptomyces sp. NPDC002886 TaxID=3364667 RepID=UPI003698269C
MFDTRKATLGFVAAGTLATSTLLGAAPAGAAPTPAADAKARFASFEGRQLDMSGDWGAAKVCMVWRTRGVVECFRTAAQQEAKAAELRGTATTLQALAACATALDLYQFADKGGRNLKFYDRGYWQNLADYNFNNSTSSYWTGACTAHLAENNGGGGYWYPGNTGPNHIENSMRSGWDNRVSSIKID